MAGGDDSFEERTEDATQQRRDDWKKDGRVIQSRELSGAIMLLAITTVLGAAGPGAACFCPAASGDRTGPLAQN